jgi:hypothetical protein
VTIKLSWRFEGGKHVLYRQGSKTPVLSVVADQIYPGMWRILDRDGNLSDLGNITRIKDAAVAIAMADYDNQVRRRVERRAGSPYSDSRAAGLPSQPPGPTFESSSAITA